MKRVLGQSRVLLTHSNHIFNDDKQRQKMEPYPPLYTLLVAAVLRQAGHYVEVCDLTFDDPQVKLHHALESLAPCLVFVCEDDFNFLTKMCLSRNRELAFWIAATAQDYGCVALAHGSDATDHVREYLDAGFDAVLIGEVEDTIRQLASDQPWQNIAGLTYADDVSGEVRRTARRSLRTNLDELPSPAWDLIDIEQYREAWYPRHGYFSMNLISSRGCPYRCNWCAKPTYGNSYHAHSPRAVAKEMCFLKTRYRPDQIWFADDIFALSARWTGEFANAVSELDAAIPFKMQSRCDLMTRECVSDLKRAGCSSVWMGAESGSQRILDAMDKGTRVEHIFTANENLRKNGIAVGWFLQFGYPGEDWDDIQKTIEMVRQTRPTDVGISVSYPLPGTKFFQIISSQLGKKKNWEESGDLSMMFRGTFSTGFYRALAHALHLEVRSPEAREAIHAAWIAVEQHKQQESALQRAAS